MAALKYFLLYCQIIRNLEISSRGHVLFKMLFFCYLLYGLDGIRTFKNSQNETLNLNEAWIKSYPKNAHLRLHNMSSKLNLNLFASLEKQINLLTSGYWGKEAWRPPPKWNIRLCENSKNKVWYHEKWVGRHVSLPPKQSVNMFLSYLLKFVNTTIFALVVYHEH